jgi:hypothetical protein
LNGQFTVERSLCPESILDRSIGSPPEVLVHVQVPAAGFEQLLCLDREV